LPSFRIAASPVTSTSAPPATADATTHSSSGSLIFRLRWSLHHDTITQLRFDFVDGLFGQFQLAAQVRSQLAQDHFAHHQVVLEQHMCEQVGA